MAAIDRRALAVALTLLIAHEARADDRYAASVHGYGDSDGLSVLHPHVAARAEIDEDTAIGASWDADVISAATIDVRTSASPRAFEEMRNGVGLDLERALARGVRLGASGAGSVTPDFGSITAGARLSLEDDARVHTATIAATGSWSSVGRAGDQGPLGEAWAGGLSLGWSIVLGPALVLDLAAAGERASGYLESPYRYVSIYAPGDPLARVAVPEQMPDDRTRGAARVGLRIAISDAVFARASYRLHADDWGVLGHTVLAGLTIEPFSALRVGADLRFLGQRGASFYCGRYETLPIVPDARTRDRELAPSITLAAGLRIELELGRVSDALFTLVANGEVAWARYFDTPLLPERTAGSGGLGLVITR